MNKLNNITENTEKNSNTIKEINNTINEIQKICKKIIYVPKKNDLADI